MPDFTLMNHGSLVILTPHTDDARVWIDEHIAPEHMTWVSGVVIEPRYVEAILDGISNDGLEVG